MTPDTQNFIAELEQRIAELSTALEVVTESRDRLQISSRELDRERIETRDALRTSRATIDRLRLHIQQGVEL